MGGQVLEYDAENRLARALTGGYEWKYRYNGEGRRVAAERWNNGTLELTRSYYYAAEGELLAEVQGALPTGWDRKYVGLDHLGSTRLVLKANGSGVGMVDSRHDYLPFGEEVPDRGAGYGDAAVVVKFTGKERDAETGLDYFGARYLSSGLGRFTGVDPYNVGAITQDPQSWNAYSYVVGNPLKYMDPHGLSYQVCDAEGKNCANITDAEFERFREGNSELNFRGGTSGSIYVGETKSGIFRQTDVDVTSAAFFSLARGTQQAAPTVNSFAMLTIGFVGLASGAEVATLTLDSGITLIPGLAPTAEYTGAIRALDALGKTNPGAVLSSIQARALAQNVVDVLKATAVVAATRGGPYVDSFRRQLENPLFAFLDQIPGPLKDALVQAAAKVGITVK
jgi:RHS repeat-associated protein